MSKTPWAPKGGSIAITDLIGGGVLRAPVTATVADIARIIIDKGVGAVVLGDEERPDVLVTERDVVRAVAAGQDVESEPATEVASRHLLWCESADTVEKAAMRMTDKQIRHLLVEEDGLLVGIVSARDLLGVYATDGYQAG